jgi:hypothetical protein
MMRREGVAVGLVTVALAGAFALLATTEYRFTDDSEAYVRLARALARGDGWSLATWRHTPFPPGFPLILAPMEWLFPGSFAAAAIWASLLAALVFPLTWLWVRPRGAGLAWAIAGLTVGSRLFLDFATENPMSDAVYLALSAGVMLWAERRERSSAAHPSWAWTFTGCLLLTALPALRLVGAAAVVAGAVVLLSKALPHRPGAPRLEIREAIPVLLGALFLVVWLEVLRPVHGEHLSNLWAAAQGGALGSGLVATLERARENLMIYAVAAGKMLTAGVVVRPSWFTPALLAVPVLAAGWWNSARGEGRFAAWYSLVYLGVILLWPFNLPRYVLPLLPFLWLFLLEGTGLLLGAMRARARWLRVAGIGWALVGAGGLLLAFWNDRTAFHFQERVGAGFWLLLLITLTIGWKVLSGLARGLTPRAASGLVVLGAALLSSAAVYKEHRFLLRRARGTLPMWGPQLAMSRASSWIESHTSADAVILATDASRIAFATGRRTVALPVTLDSVPFRQIAQRSPAGFLFIIESDIHWNKPNDPEKFPVIQQVFADRLRPVHHFDGGTIYAILPEPKGR